MAKLRDADDLLLSAVKKTITELDLDDMDAAAVELAEQYATAIDASYCDKCEADSSLDTLGPKLLAVLESLGATPVARSKIRKGVASGDGPSRLSALRAARPG
jgi:hypothetical protein